MRLSILALLASLAVAAGPVGAMPSPSLVDGFGSALNSYRAQAGLHGLRADPRLNAAAQAYAETMAATGHVSHTGRDGSTAGVRARRAGCDGGYMAENIAWGQRSADATFQGWAASAGHRANMLGRPYGVFGIGQSGGMWVMMFADNC